MKKQKKRSIAVSKIKGRVTILMRSKRTSNVFAKQYRSNKSASRAIAGLKASKSVQMIQAMPAKGAKFGALVKRFNRKYSK